MDSYCDINNTYINNNKGILPNNQIQSRDLEKIARQINNDKRTKTKDVYRQYRNNTKCDSNNSIIVSPHHQSSDINMTCFSNNNGSSGFYSAQGDYLENKYQPNNTSGTLIHDINNNNKISIKHRKSKYDDISLDTPSLNCDSDSSTSSSDSLNSSLTWNIKEIDKQIKSKSKFDTKKRSKRHKCIEFDLNSVDSLESLDSGESLLRHIRFCTECKDKVIDLIRKNKSNQKNTPDNKLINEIKNLDLNHKIIENMDNYTDENHYISKPKPLHEKSKICHSPQKLESFIPEIKEIITVCLIGFLIIMILDLIMRSS
jgi:hypothetical protein